MLQSSCPPATPVWRPLVALLAGWSALRLAALQLVAVQVPALAPWLLGACQVGAALAAASQVQLLLARRLQQQK